MIIRSIVSPCCKVEVELKEGWESSVYVCSGCGMVDKNTWRGAVIIRCMKSD